MPTKEQIAGYKRKYRTGNRKKFAYWQRKSRYKKQGLSAPYPPSSRCESCNRLFSETSKGACLDHCHLTGLFRGWLCSKCNSALGLAGDTPEAIQRLMDYITQAYESINRRLTE